MAKNKNRNKTTQIPQQRPKPKPVTVNPAGEIPVEKNGIYTEYLNAQMTFNDLNRARKLQLKRISDLRDGRAVLVIAADLNKGGSAPISITYQDLVAVNDQLSVLTGDKIDVIIETPGGLGEVVEDIVKLLRNQFQEVGVIVPGYAKSAGTLLAMAADEILMEPASALGPIDAQISYQGKQFSAEAFITGLDKIKEEVQKTGVLNKAYIPILQAISPGEIQHAENALNFAKILVTQWLANYKFKNWDTHSSTGQTVTNADKISRAQEIADQLADHSRWLTHGRSLKIEDLRKMRLLITDYSENLELAEAIRRYFVLLQMTFAGPMNVYKIFETPKTEIMRLQREEQIIVPPNLNPLHAESGKVDFRCNNCNHISKIQANFRKSTPIESGYVPFPATNKIKCSNCGNDLDLTKARRDIEAQAGRKIV